MAETLNQRWAATLVGTLRALGLRHAVISPGSRSTPLALAFAERGDVRCWSVLDERSGAFMALGLTRAANEPVALLGTSGTAGAHWLPALMEAAEVGARVVAITADRPWELHGFGALQTVPQDSLFGRFVRAQALLPAPSEDAGVLPHLVAELSRTLAEGAGVRPGPVHLNVPFREPLVHPEGAPGPRVDPTPPWFLKAEGRSSAPELESLVRAARKPMIVVGPRAPDEAFFRQVHALAEAWGAPVLAEATSNVRFGASGALRHADLWLRSPKAAQALQPDLVLRLGGGLSSKLTQQWLDASGARTVVVREGGPLVDAAHAATLLMEADGVRLCASLQSVATAARGYRELALAVDQRAAQALSGQPAVLDEPGVAREVVSAVSAGANLVLSSSMPVRDVDAFSSRASPVRVFSNRGLNGIDGVMSTAVGVAASGDRSTVLLVGDVALLHDAGAWVTAKRCGVSLVVVVINNDGGGIFSFLPVSGRTAHFEALFGTPHGVELGALAALGGARHHQPADVAALRAALEEAQSGGLHLIEVRTRRDENVDAHRTRQAAVVAAVEAMTW